MTQFVDIDFVSHNMTEGWPTADARNADVVLGQEIDRQKIIEGLPGKEHFFPAQDSHQSISWNPELEKEHQLQHKTQGKD